MTEPAIPEISAAELRAKQERGDEFLLLDVREPEEVAIATIAGSTHIPMGDVPSRQQELDPDQEIVVYCHAGIRSLSVAVWLQRQDFANVKNLAGGIDAWSREIAPNVPRS